ncbi:MAG: TonB-dependent receptor [Bacteroidales bacterium]|nr:TonB-dependent receptor [Bacteroidales bacterium]
MRKTIILLLLLLPLAVLAQTVSGTISDATTGETLIGATILEEQSGKGTVSNAQGRFSLTLKADTAHLRISYIGYQTEYHTVTLRGDRKLDVTLHPSVELEEVTITAERINSPQASQMSAIEVPVEQLKLVPVIFGETDVLKAIQLLPGVQSGTEGMSGIYVRGGGADENLFLLDGVPLYNVNHLGGFFSAFNGDAVKNVTLYKGSFPARFSGRISSVLDITTNNGNDREWHGGASVGLMSAKFNIEGPIIKEKTTLSLSLRRTYGDLLLQPLIMAVALSETEGQGTANAGYYFYDLNAKVTHQFNDRSRLYFMWYSGDDEAYMRMRTNEYELGKEHIKLGYQWGNLATSVRWNYELTPKLFMNVTGSFTRYRQHLDLGVEEEWTDEGQLYNEQADVSLRSGISDFSGQVDFDFAPTPDHAIKFGTTFTHHLFRPQVTSVQASSTGEEAFNRTVGESNVSAGEISIYAEDDWSITDALKVNGGLALTGFVVQDCFYPSLQPRLSGRLLLTDDLSLKAGYSYMTQYMHLLSNSNISLPSDLWVPVTARIEPMNSHQVAAGVVYTWRSLIDFSVEGYYKWMNNLLEYKPGATFLGNGTGWEDMVCMGRGWAYGIEFLAQKSFGDITGWVGYTWSRTMRQFDTPGEELNGGLPFPAKYDRIHDISITLQYKPNNRFDAGITWVYSTGNTATLALQEIEADNYYGALDFVESRNNFRLPAYHRMDVSVNFHKQKKHGVRTWNISIYNLYNRQNPFLIYPKTTYNYRDNSTYTGLYQRSLFPILPSISYIYKF